MQSMVRILPVLKLFVLSPALQGGKALSVKCRVLKQNVCGVCEVRNTGQVSFSSGNSVFYV